MTEYKDMLRLAARRKISDTNSGTWRIICQFEPNRIHTAAAIGKAIVDIDPSAQWRIETVGGRPVKVEAIQGT